MSETREVPKVVRHVVQCVWKCKHCREAFGSENVNHYGVSLPELIQPTWFFCSMALLDHLRDCRGVDHSDELRDRFGVDFLNHRKIYEWYNTHAVIERQYLSEQELDKC